MTYKKFMSLFLIAGSIASTLCSCAATDSSAVVGYIDEHPITMEEFNYFLCKYLENENGRGKKEIYIPMPVKDAVQCFGERDLAKLPKSTFRVWE